MSAFIEYDERDGHPIIVTKNGKTMTAVTIPDGMYPSGTPFGELVEKLYGGGVITREDAQELLLGDTRPCGLHVVGPKTHARLVETGMKHDLEMAGIEVEQALLFGGKKDGTDGQAGVFGSVRRSGGRPRTWWERFIAYVDWIFGGRDRRGTAYW